MENQVTLFTNEEFGNVRTVMVGDKIYFVGKDVAECLGYAKPRNAISVHCKKGIKHNVLTNGGYQNTTVIPESDVYRLIAKSKLPNAERFEEWLFDEVLPQIQNTEDSTTVKEEDEDEDKVTMAKALLIFQKKLEEKDKQLEELKKIILELEPKAEYADAVLQSNDTLTIDQIAKDYGWTAHKMNLMLDAFGIQYKMNKQWLLYSEYCDKGYTESYTVLAEQEDGSLASELRTRWTQIGRMFIYEQLKKYRILPLKERNK